MNVSWRYRLRILATGLCFLIQNTYLTYSDALPFSIEDSGIVQNEDEEQITTGFFELQTLEFNTNKDRSPKNDPLSRDRTMTLSTKDLERYVDGKRRSMAVDYMKQAEEYIQNEEWDKASEEIDMALIRYPDSVELMGNAAMMYALIGNYAEASTLFRVYLQHHPDEVNHLAAWGGVLLRLNQLPSAYEMIHRSLKLDPKNIPARYQMEIHDLLAGKDATWDHWNELSIQELNNVVSWLISEEEELVELIGPTDYAELVRRVVGKKAGENLDTIKPMVLDLVTAQQEQDFNTSMTLCAKLIQQGVDNLWVRIVLAQSCFETGKERKAEDIMALMQRLYPDFVPVWYNGGFMALRLEKYDEAEHMYKESLAREESGVSLFALACALAGQEKIDEAWTILKQLKHTDPVMLQQWLEGDEPYLNNIKHHSRFYEVGIKGGLD